MKKFYLFVLALGFSSLSKAQLTQANHAPLAGDTYTLYHCDSTGVSPGGAGAGVTWNYSTIKTLTTSSFNYTTGASSSTVYPNANIVVLTKPNDATYIKTSATGIDYYGGPIVVGPVVGGIIYSNPAKVMTYPCSLNAIGSATATGTINVSTPLSGSGTFTGNTNVTADATGTLVFSNRTYTNVMRVVSSQTLNYTISGLPGSIVYKIYDWYTPSIKQPVFTISTSTLTTFAGPNTQSFVARHMASMTASSTPTPTDTGIRDYQADNSLEVYPNPAANTLNITLSSPEAYVRLYDVTGKMVLNEKITLERNSISTANLPDGVYVCEVVGDGKLRKTQKVVIQH